MVHLGYKFSRTNKCRSSLDPSSDVFVNYCRIMKAHEKIGDNQKVIELFQEFKSQRLSFLVKKSGSIYTTLCLPLTKSGRVFKTLEFLEEMRDKEIPESSELYSTLIRAFAKAREVVITEKLFKEAEGLKLLKDPEMCLKVVLMYVREGKMERTLEVVAAMRNTKLKVFDCILCAIVNGFCKQILVNRGKIDRVMAGIMVGVFSKTSRIDELMRLLQDMKVEGTRLDARLYSLALSALHDAGLNSQIRWLQERFDIAQTSASRSLNTKNIRT